MNCINIKFFIIENHVMQGGVYISFSNRFDKLCWLEGPACTSIIAAK